MTTEGFADDGTMLKNLAQFDLALEMADSEWSKVPSGTRAGCGPQVAFADL
jgi:hypothetical protein